MQQKLFYDRHQSLRVILIDGIVYVTIYFFLIWSGFTYITVLLIFHGSMFHVTVFMLDAFLSVVVDWATTQHGAGTTVADGAASAPVHTTTTMTACTTATTTTHTATSFAATRSPLASYNASRAAATASNAASAPLEEE